MLQSLAQLETRYSKAESQTILDGLRTEIYLAGTGLETAERVSRRLGRKRPNSMDDKVAYSDANLLNPDEIITMKNTEALLFYANKKPLKYKVLPYYKHRLFSNDRKCQPLNYRFCECTRQRQRNLTNQIKRGGIK